ncbi:hypothetical protein JB92DRAFT_3035224 [Gautieria morchelliformis]|nr:hypothetical protein JB92DRAFT_3035224 [Gautieria morchelliformis]
MSPTSPPPIKISQIGGEEANGRNKLLTNFDARRSCPTPNLAASEYAKVIHLFQDIDPYAIHDSSSLGACYVKPLSGKHFNILPTPLCLSHSLYLLNMLFQELWRCLVIGCLIWSSCNMEAWIRGY